MPTSSYERHKIIQNFLTYRSSMSAFPSSSDTLSQEEVETLSRLFYNKTQVIVAHDTIPATPDYYPRMISHEYRDFVDSFQDPYVGKFKSVLRDFNGIFEVKFKDRVLDALGKQNSRGQTLAYMAARFHPNLAFDLLYQCCQRGHKLDEMVNSDGCNPQHGYAWGLTENSASGVRPRVFLPAFGLVFLFWRFGCDKNAKNHRGETVNDFYKRAILTRGPPLYSHNEKIVGMDAILQSDWIPPKTFTYTILYDIGTDRRTVNLDLEKLAQGIINSMKYESWEDWRESSLRDAIIDCFEQAIAQKMHQLEDENIEIYSTFFKEHFPKSKRKIGFERADVAKQLVLWIAEKPTMFMNVREDLLSLYEKGTKLEEVKKYWDSVNGDALEGNGGGPMQKKQKTG